MATKEKQLELGTIGQDGCCCGEVTGKDYTITAHCWRTGSCCPYSGVHFKGADSDEMLDHAKAIAEYITENYRTDVAMSPSKF